MRSDGESEDLEPGAPVVRLERESAGELTVRPAARAAPAWNLSTSYRRHLAPGLQPDPARRGEGERRRLPAAAVAYLASLGVALCSGRDRRRLLLPLHGVPQGLSRAQPEAHPHHALHAQDQRQGRAFHTDRAARIGLHSGLLHLSPSRRQAATLAPLQLASATRRDKVTNSHQPPRLGSGQTADAPHLALRELEVETEGLQHKEDVYQHAQNDEE